MHNLYAVFRDDAINEVKISETYELLLQTSGSQQIGVRCSAANMAGQARSGGCHACQHDEMHHDSTLQIMTILTV